MLRIKNNNIKNKVSLGRGVHDLLNTYYGPMTHLETVQRSVSTLLLRDLLEPKTMDS